MQHPGPQPKPDEAADAAAAWAARRTDERPLSAEERQRFEAWLAADPAHGPQLARLERAWRDPHVVAAAHRAAGRGHASRRRAIALAAAASVAAAAWCGRAPIQRSLADHATGIGEIGALDAGPGARLLLDTASAISAEGEGWRLVQGAARVDLDAGRALGLAGGFGRVRGEGARFVLRRFAASDRLVVLSGHVVAGNVGVPAGYGAVLAPDRVARPSPLDAAERDAAEGFAEAWRLFHAAPLAVVLADLARYRLGPLWASEAAGLIHVTGRFRFIDPEGVLTALAATLPVRLQRLGPAVRIVPA